MQLHAPWCHYNSHTQNECNNQQKENPTKPWEGALKKGPEETKLKKREAIHVIVSYRH
jgi:hypothetical protein